MKTVKVKLSPRVIRHRRVRAKVSGTAECPRLVVFRSNKYIYASLVDDASGKTLVSVNDKDHEVEAPKTDFAKVDAAYGVGKLLADRAKGVKINKVVFDRGGYRYMGRVAALARGARDGGLEF